MATLQFITEDNCCKARLERDLYFGLAGKEWHCPACGTQWVARAVDGAVVWEPVCVYAVIR